MYCKLIFFNLSAIIWAANNGHIETVEALLKIGYDINDQSNNGRSPLLWASYWGHVDMVQYLIDHNANINLIDVDGMTALMLAILHNRHEIIHILINNGANVVIKNSHDATALTIAQTKENQEIIELLKPYFLSSEPSKYFVILLFQQLYKYGIIMTQRGIEKTKYHFGLTSSKYMETEL